MKREYSIFSPKNEAVWCSEKNTGLWGFWELFLFCFLIFLPLAYDLHPVSQLVWLLVSSPKIYCIEGVVFFLSSLLMWNCIMLFREKKILEYGLFNSTYSRNDNRLILVKLSRFHREYGGGYVPSIGFLCLCFYLLLRFSFIN